MLILISAELNFAYLQHERLREAQADRLVDLAVQHAKATRQSVRESERKDINP
jgi:hypothetical protein